MKREPNFKKLKIKSFIFLKSLCNSWPPCIITFMHLENIQRPIILIQLLLTSGSMKIMLGSMDILVPGGIICVPLLFECFNLQV